MRRAAALSALALGLLIAALLFRAFRFTSRQVRVEPGAIVPVDAAAAAERFAGALRIVTVFPEDPSARVDETFSSLHSYLARSFPNVHARLRRELVGRAALLYTWQGTDISLQPIVLCGHLDVVPVEPGTDTAWSHPPFGGQIADEYIWGRGALDDKLGVLAILEAIEMLVAHQFQPRRTVLLAFGADEEVGGAEGARQIATLLQARHHTAEFVLDEGGIISDGNIPGVAAPVALVGIAEKGFASIEIVAQGEGGHAALPPRHTAVGVIARAIARLEDQPFAAGFRSPAEELFSYVGPEMSFPMRLVFANRWLFGPLIERRLTRSPATDAMLRTTTAATMFEGSPKDNVLPRRARAVINVRILPGDSVAAVLAHVRDVVDDPAVQVKVLDLVTEPSPLAPTDSPTWGLLQRTVREIFPDIVVAPYLTLGATDARHYAPLTRNIYRFVPVRLTPQDLARVHGTDERVSVANYAEAVRFYAQLVQNAAR
jgi:carboxypeptidase PM20D1